MKYILSLILLFNISPSALHASQTKSIGGSIGYTMYGGGSAGLNHSRSKEHKISAIHTNTQIKAGNSINIKSTYSYSNSLGANLSYSASNTKNNNKQPNPTKEPQSIGKISNIGINHSNSMQTKASKTLATLGKGNIQIASLEKSDDLSKLNQDVTKINKQLYESNINTKVDASLDTRFLTEEGTEEIKLDYLYAKTHVKELAQASKDVLGNKELNILDFSSQVKKYASDRDLLIAAQQEQSQKDKDGLKGEEGAKGSQRAIQGLSNKLSQKDKLRENANIILYNSDKTPDKTKVYSQNDFNKQLSNAGYHEKTNSIAINVKNTDMTDSSQVIKATLHEQERHTQSQTNQTHTLSKTTQTNLAKARGERGSDTWESFAGTSGYNTKSNTNQSTWNNNNINSQTISSGNKIVNDMKSEEVKPFLPLAVAGGVVAAASYANAPDVGEEEKTGPTGSEMLLPLEGAVVISSKVIVKASQVLTKGKQLTKVTKTNPVTKQSIQKQLDSLPNGQGKNYIIKQNKDGSFNLARKKGNLNTQEAIKNGEVPPLKVSKEGNIYTPNGVRSKHGNTLNDRPAECYSLNCRKTGEVVKYGETTRGESMFGRGNQKRHTRTKLEEMDAKYTKISNGTKKQMHEKQHKLIEEFKKNNDGKRPKYNKNDY